MSRTTSLAPIRMRAERLSPEGTVARRLALRNAGDGPARRAAFPFPEDLTSAASIYDLDEDTLYLAWEIARLSDATDRHDQRAACLLVLAALVAQSAGSTRVPVRGPDRPHLRDLFAALGGSEADLVNARALLDRRSCLAPILGGPEDRKPLVLADDHLYLHKLFRLEVRLACWLRGRLATAAAPPDRKRLKRALGEVLASPPIEAGVALELTSDQKAAVLAALAAPITLITGGPGTGKTSIIAALLRMLVRLGVPVDGIALCAPTGRAAQRMAEAITQSLGRCSRSIDDEILLRAGPTPQTMHRLLGYSPRRDRFCHHERNPLAQRVVIADESSMIDLALMDRLASALRPDAHLILLGDADQLPPVGAGAVFCDLCAAPVPRVTLTHSHRMSQSDAGGRRIFAAAAHIRTGDDTALLAELTHRTSVDAIEFVGAELLVADAEPLLEGFLDRWFREHILADGLERLARKSYRYGPDGFSGQDAEDVRALFALSSRARILTATRASPRTGAAAVNERLHQHLVRALGGATQWASAPVFFPGEPIVMSKNDYDRGLFNGDQGLVLRVADGANDTHRFMAVFPRQDELRAFHLDALRAQIDRAFAMTVHRSQGADLDKAALVLPERELPIVSRELLYTAVTRSRRSVVLVGRPGLVAAAARARTERSTGLAEQLRTPL
jgi:exodeoxyribonuclease V alpha subunit